MLRTDAQSFSGLLAASRNTRDGLPLRDRLTLPPAKSWILAISIASTTFGCATQQQTAALECGAAGAAGAFLLCRVLGGDNRMCAPLAVVVAAGGGAICYTYAGSLEKRQQQLAGQENNLDARLQYVRGLNEDSEKLNRQLEARVKDSTQRADEVVAQINLKTISQAELAKAREALDNEVRSANTQFELATKALEDMKRFQAQRAPESRALDAEIARQEKLLAETQRQTSTLAAQRQRIA
jgi:hypothetical protein